MLFYLAMIASDDDRSKFEIIYSAYRDLMLHVADRILGDKRDSEDVVHQSFLKLIKILDKIDEPRSHKTRSLVVTIVERTAIDLYRRRRRENLLPLNEEAVPAEYAPPSDRIDERLDLAAAMASLPDRYREVLLLRYDNGLSHREIAKLLSMSEVSVRKTVQRAKELLREQLQEGGEGSHENHG